MCIIIRWEGLDEAKKAGVRLSDVDLINELPALKKERPFLVSS